MIKTSDLLRENRKSELWTKYAGFMHLSMKEFMEIQNRLMREQLHLLSNSIIGQEFMGGRTPANIEEYRAIVPLTTYQDYAKYLDEKNEAVLPVKPYTWTRSSGRTTPSGCKWIPFTKTMYDTLANAAIGSFIMSSCTFEGEVRLERFDKILLATAPLPYMSGLMSYAVRDQSELGFLPSLEEGDRMAFGDRVAEGFRLAMREGVDFFYGMSSVLAAMGERFETQSAATKPSRDMLNPLVLWRLIKALITSKIGKRNLLPKDIWRLKGISAGGTDTEIYSDKIEYYWGRRPLEGYGLSEGGALTMQGWNYKGMMFFPDCDFLEFIPIDEHQKNREDPTYQPKTVLLDELELGMYELVFTNFHGGTLMRYKPGDIFEVMSIGDEEIKSVLPQVRFYSRVSDFIDLAGFARLTEKDIWKGIEASGVGYQDWTARKEILGSEPILHLYIEPKATQNFNEEEAKEKIDSALQDLVSDYLDLKTMLKKDPLQVTCLPEGAFAKYMKAQQDAGADLAHVKPPHMQTSDETIRRLTGA
jgi:hypothetical protein